MTKIQWKVSDYIPPAVWEMCEEIALGAGFTLTISHDDDGERIVMAKAPDPTSPYLPGPLAKRRSDAMRRAL